jgi:hypothetical protein
MAELVNLGPQDVLQPMALVIQNLQRVLAMFDRLVRMAPPAPVEAFELRNTSLEQRTPYEVSMSDTQDLYFLSRWSSTGFMTSKLHCLRSTSWRGASVVQHM